MMHTDYSPTEETVQRLRDTIEYKNKIILSLQHSADRFMNERNRLLKELEELKKKHHE